MAVTAGVGTSIATDDVAGVQYQRVKVDLGGDGLASPLVRGQQSAANSLPVTLPSDQGALTVDGSGVTQPVSAASLPLPTGAATAAKQPALGTAGTASADVISVQGVASMTALKVDGSAVTQPVSGTVTANLAAGTNNIGDVDILSIAAGDNNIGNVDIVTMPNVTLAAGTNTNEVVGDAAHDAAVSGNPVLTGSEARTSDGTAVANGDAVRTIADTLGKQVVLQGAVHDLHARGTANYTNTTASDLIAAAGAGVRIAVTSVLVTNAHATVGTKVEIRDGTTAKIIGYAAPNGGGFTLNAGGAPLFISTANTAVTGRNVTTGADVDITVSGYKIGN